MSGTTNVEQPGVERTEHPRGGIRATLGRLLRENRWPLRIAVLVALGDQATKALVASKLPLHASVPIIEGLLNVTHIRNTGAAFGFLNSVDLPFKAAIMTLIGATALLAILVYAATLPSRERVAQIGLALILGGAVGNLIDRATAGYVVDFVDVYWRDYHFWAFNVADSAITVGAFTMILDTLGQRSHVPKAS